MGFLSKIGKSRLEVIAMSNLRPSDTGVSGAVIWVSAGEFEGKGSPHGPRIKVMQGNRVTTEGLETATTITLANPIKVIGKLPINVQKQAIQFVQLNQKLLLRYWNTEVSTREFLDALEKII